MQGGKEKYNLLFLINDMLMNQVVYCQENDQDLGWEWIPLKAKQNWQVFKHNQTNKKNQVSKLKADFRKTFITYYIIQ